jgi:hypothetical protein
MARNVPFLMTTTFVAMDAINKTRRVKKTQKNDLSVVENQPRYWDVEQCIGCSADYSQAMVALRTPTEIVSIIAISNFSPDTLVRTRKANRHNPTRNATCRIQTFWKCSTCRHSQTLMGS